MIDNNIIGLLIVLAPLLVVLLIVISHLKPRHRIPRPWEIGGNEDEVMRELINQDLERR